MILRLLILFFVGAGTYTASVLKFALVASTNPANTIVRPTNLYSANATIPANGTLILAGNKKALKGKLIIDVMAI